MDFTKLAGLALRGLMVLGIAAGLAGCETGTPTGKMPVDTTGGKSPATSATASGDLLAVNDKLIVSFNDLVIAVPPVDCQIRDDGSVTLILNQTFQAAGKTIGEFEKEIRARYVPKFYVNMTPTVKSQERFFVVGGEVRQPNRYVYLSKMTVLRAIDSAGGFTDFARRSRVTITRASGKQITVNCVRALEHPELDLDVFPGDKITVKKRLF